MSDETWVLDDSVDARGSSKRRKDGPSSAGNPLIMRSYTVTCSYCLFCCRAIHTVGSIETDLDDAEAGRAVVCILRTAQTMYFIQFPSFTNFVQPAGLHAVDPGP